MKRIKFLLTTIITLGFCMASDGGVLGAGIGAGIVVIGAGIGIGILASAAANATARQPEAAGDIRTTALIMSALIEGVALFCAVTCFLLSGNVGG